MRIILVVATVVAMGCGTKKNPEACCVDEADCAGVGLPVGSTCDDGLLCRNNRCVELSCSSSASCDLLAPYCADGLCQEPCTDDAQCPGFGQTSAQRFCETAVCVECRAAMNDCGVAAPVCDAGTCRKCELNDECNSGVCTADGSCAAETSIAYVAPAGSASSGCTRNEPCSFARALDPGINRPYVVLANGSYQFAGTRDLDGLRSFIGEKGGRPRLSNTMAGPVFKLGSGADIAFDNVEIRGATSTSPSAFDGNGIECPSNFQKSTVRVSRSVFTQNSVAGLLARQCNVEVRETTFVANARGLEAVDVMGTIERSTFALNTGIGISLDAGLYSVTNNFIYRNPRGIDLNLTTAGSVFEFNTVADNSMTGVSCVANTGQFAFPNNLIGGNGNNIDPQPPGCVFSSSMIVAGDTAPLKFKSPSSIPYDYHLTPGSIAIDQISTSTQVRDFDGEARPYGNGHDYGADELH
jgi:hypothetical protein